MLWSPRRWHSNPYSFLVQIVTQSLLTTLSVQYRFDDEVKDDTLGVFTPQILKLPQSTWIETFLEGVTDQSDRNDSSYPSGPQWFFQVTIKTHSFTGLSVFQELVWFTYKVSGVMCSTSVCDRCWSVEGCIHSQRRNRIDKKLDEKLVRTHTNLVLREFLDDTLRDLLPSDIELIIDEPVDE